FLFSAILNEGNSSTNFSKEVIFQSERDFNIHQMEEAEPVIFDRLSTSQGKMHDVESGAVRGCGRSQGFLSTVAELVDDAVKHIQTPVSLCYLYNGQRYSMTLDRTTPVADENVKFTMRGQQQPYTRRYRDLVRMQFANFNETTKKGSRFELLAGAKGEL